MTREEMKNRISMALKDPILQQGFEIICKENAELNKKLSKAEADYDKMFWNKNEIISKAKEIIKMLHSDCYSIAEYAENNLEKAYSRIAELEAYNEKLLDGDIEKHNKIVILEKENAKLKEKLGDKVMQDQKDKADLVWKLKTANEQKTSQLAYALTIIKDLLDNSDEYARQRAEDFLKECE